MKKLLFLMGTVAVLFSSCSKEKQLANRLDGEWNITQLDYSGKISTPIGLLNVANTAYNSGFLKFDNGSKKSSYQLVFDAEVLVFSDTLRVPVNLVGSGTFRNTKDKVIITDDSTAEVREFEVITNDKTRQVWTTIFPVVLRDTVLNLNQTVNTNLKLYLNKK